MANFKRRKFRSSTMKKCSWCGSQRRLGSKGGRLSGKKLEEAKRVKLIPPQPINK